MVPSPMELSNACETEGVTPSTASRSPSLNEGGMLSPLALRAVPPRRGGYAL